MSASPALPARPSRPSSGSRNARRASGGDECASEGNAWIGVDFARMGQRPVSRSWLPLALLALLAALAVAALRIDLIRTRYALADALERERALIIEQRALIAEQRRLREPTRQAARARDLGLRPAESVFFVVDPSPAGQPGAARPAVAAGPPILRAAPARDLVGKPAAERGKHLAEGGKPLAAAGRRPAAAASGAPVR